MSLVVEILYQMINNILTLFGFTFLGPLYTIVEKSSGQEFYGNSKIRLAERDTLVQ